MKVESKHYVLAIIVAALGYFVDIYDLLLFSIVRVASLKDLGVSGEDLLAKGVLLINSQMAGLLVGGIIWGILGDKRGRLSVLFGSIILYSASNILNSFIHSIEAYATMRFFAGVGLAGELGAGITLVSELMPQKIRGYGTSIVAGVGILGAVFGGLIGDLVEWRTAYIIGGCMGFALLLLRIGVRESGLFEATKEKSVQRGKFLMLFSDPKSFKKYLAIIIAGVPIWYVIGILITFAPEFGSAMGMSVIPAAGKAVMFSYFGLALGDFASGILSQKLQSRRKVMAIFLAALSVVVLIHLLMRDQSISTFYWMTGVLGFASGYWALFVTVASEQFGTNIRSTATTTVPNFVRGSVIPVTALFQLLRPSFGVLQSGGIVGAVVLALAFLSLRALDETFHKDLDYHEAH